jgi:hypothetical protein
MGKAGTELFKTTKDDISQRKFKGIMIHDPQQKWYKIGRAIVEKHSNVLYPDEQSVTSFLKLCLKYGDACIQTITRERFALEKRHTTLLQRKEQAQRELDRLAEEESQ